MQEKGFWEGMKDAAPTALGYISIGLAFGIVAAAAGLSPLEVGLMSLLIYGGSAQFAMVAMFVSGANLGTITLTVFLVNLRNMLMSLHATTIFTKSSLWQNIGIGTLITDESYGVLLGENVHNKNIQASWMHGNNLLSYLAWVWASVAGTLLGNTIPNPENFGLDFALIAMFIGLLVSQFDAMVLTDGTKKVVLVLITVAVSFVLLSMLLSEALAVLCSTLIGCGVGVVLDES
ncbi:AzlC family ABC transporter permease [Streptococcus ratti]|uniref:AzlC family ABC transporter permease n=2 Tax=Streptococcus ratti TaxID=1341 RepID=A0A7X9QFZ7_STRRT|nr:AzlC family ABC transporter permease [Streptococcus ratti]VEI60718.1 branched-chain amino acid transporter protein [Streptococcus mutans]EJN94434.1 amino acid permease, putative [Streptococcus ratti FA-1 = DSM 20564]EMP70421.1 branched-chain amino acid transporter protein [Streptococcus ratti FA-1 = DSM 20564]NMD48818.1 AzlC family ABC transporter permease [Streptococcus ratti]QEY06374.1 AzlC family ABC transporter permease [Streptococcus ratti]